MKVNVKVPYEACELCGAFDPQVSTRLIWEENRIIGRETEITCARSGICVDIRIAARREEVMKSIRNESETDGSGKMEAAKREYYLCDPEKNTDCTKRRCFMNERCSDMPESMKCRITLNPDYAKRDEHGEKMIWRSETIMKSESMQVDVDGMNLRKAIKEETRELLIDLGAGVDEVITGKARKQLERTRIGVKPLGAAIVIAIETGLIRRTWNRKFKLGPFLSFWNIAEEALMDSVTEKVCKEVKEILRAREAAEKPAKEQTDPELRSSPDPVAAVIDDRLDPGHAAGGD